MEGRKGVDEMDRNILRILSDYEQLTPLQLWYELGESYGEGERLTEKQILSRLESLTARGYVEKVTGMEVDGDLRLAIYRAKTRNETAGDADGNPRP